MKGLTHKMEPRTLPRIARHLLFGLGVFAAIGVWLVESPDPRSWIGQVMAPRYSSAIAGYQILSRGRSLSKQDLGFGELLEFTTVEGPQLDTSQIDALRLGGLGIEASGTSIFFELLGKDGRSVYARLVYNPTVALREYFFDTKIQRTKGALSLVGLLFTALMYVAEILERRRRERRDRDERTRVNERLVAARSALSKVNEELAAAQSELSDLKAQQDPRALFDRVKREAEWRERRGGPKNPFRT